MANFVHNSPTGVPFDNVSPVNPMVNENNAEATNHTSPPLNKFSKRNLRLKKLFNPKIIISSIVLLLLLVGGVSAMFLTQMSQDVRQQASGFDSYSCVTNPDCGSGQECKSGSCVSTNTGAGTSTTGTGVASTSVSSGTGGGSCGSGEIFCGGCIAACRPATEGCNKQIDKECKQDGCGGNGVFPGAGEQCCSGLQQCANGRCASSCGLDSNPICAGKREGSNCNNGGKWKCDSADNGHCEGGEWAGVAQEERAEIASAIGGLDEGELEYGDATTVYDKYCKGDVNPEHQGACDSLDQSLKDEATLLRAQGLNDAVSSNTDIVSNAIGKLDEGEMTYAEAKAEYDKYCNPKTAGSNYAYTSSSVCSSLDKSIQDEERRLSLEALNTLADSVNDEFKSALSAISNGSMNQDDALRVYEINCAGSKSGTTVCRNLEESLRGGSEEFDIEYTIRAIERGEMSPEAVQEVYERSCGGKSGTSICRELEQQFRGQSEELDIKYALRAIERGEMSPEAVQEVYERSCGGKSGTSICRELEQQFRGQSEELDIKYALSAISNGIMGPDAAQEVYERSCGGKSGTTICRELEQQFRGQSEELDIREVIRDISNGRMDPDDAQEFYDTNCGGSKSGSTICRELAESLRVKSPELDIKTAIRAISNGVMAPDAAQEVYDTNCGGSTSDTTICRELAESLRGKSVFSDPSSWTPSENPLAWLIDNFTSEEEVICVHKSPIGCNYESKGSCSQDENGCWNSSKAVLSNPLSWTSSENPLTWVLPMDPVTWLISRVTSEEETELDDESLATLISNISNGLMEPEAAQTIYDLNCGGGKASTTICGNLANSLRGEDEEFDINYALRAIERGEMSPEDAQEVYEKSCRGKSSTTICRNLANSLRGEDEEFDIRTAISNISNGLMEPEAAQTIYDLNCSGSKSGTTVCKNLEKSLRGEDVEDEEFDINSFSVSDPINDEINSAISSLIEEGSDSDIEVARDVYFENCTGSNAYNAVNTACKNLRVIVGGNETWECVPNKCSEGKWCGQDGAKTSIDCGESNNCDDVKVREGRCDQYGMRCVGGELFKNDSCDIASIDPLVFTNEDTNLGCFEACLSRGASAHMCTSECNNFDPADIYTSGYSSRSDCHNAKYMANVQGKCSKEGSQFFFEEDNVTEYKSCFWWSSNENRCVEDLYATNSLPTSNCKSCAAVTPEGETDQSIADIIAKATADFNEGITGLTGALSKYNDYCRNNTYSENEAVCNSLDQTLKKESERLKWEAYSNMIDVENESVDLAIDNLELGNTSTEDTLELYVKSCLGIRSQFIAANKCKDLKDNIDNADILISKFMVDRVVSFDPSHDFSDIRIMSMGEHNFTDASIDDIYLTSVPFQEMVGITDSYESLYDQATDISKANDTSVIVCNHSQNCSYYVDGKREAVTLKHITDNLDQYGLTDEDRDSLYRQGHFVLGNESYAEQLEAESLYTRMSNQYGINFSNNLTYYEIIEVNNNLKEYIALDTLSDSVSVSYLPFMSQSLDAIANSSFCEGVDDVVCSIQLALVSRINNLYDIPENIDTWEEEIGVSLKYAGDIEMGTLRVFDEVIELLPDFYWSGIEGIVVTEQYDNTSAGYTYRTGTFQMDDCIGCEVDGPIFWGSVHTLIHEAAHNRQDITVNSGNYCLDNGDCLEIEEDSTGRDLLDQYLEDNGITVTPSNELIVAKTEGITYYSDDAYAFKNAKEFYAEILSDAVVDPDGFAAKDPELYQLAVIINGFETETYTNEFGIENIRRKSQ
jgi:hypothetical protein